MKDNKFSSEAFAALSEAEQLQYFKDLVQDIPFDDLKILKDLLPELFRIQQILDSSK